MSQTNLTPTEKRMASEDLKKLVLMYSIPTVIGMLVNGLYNVVDRFWVGRIPGIGEEALAGIGLCMPIMTVGMAVSMLVGIGAATRISISLGRGERDKAEKILGQGLSMIIFFAVILTVLGLIFKRPLIAAFIGGENESTAATLGYADEYITIIISGLTASLMSFGMNHPIRATGNPKRFASTQLLGAITNIILDPVFIFVFDMGVAGAALATIISQCASCLWVMSYYFSKDPALRLKLANLRPRLDIIAEICSIGVSPFLMQAAASIVQVVVNYSLAYYGRLDTGSESLAISAMLIINSVTMFVLMPIFGINQGTQPIIGFNYGRKDYRRVKTAFRWSVVYCMIICSAGFIGIMLFASQLVALFTGSSGPGGESRQLITLGTHGMRISQAALLTVGFLSPTLNFIQSIGRAKMSIILNMLRQVIIMIPALILLPMFFGLDGIWFATPAADIIAFVVGVAFLVREFRKLKPEAPDTLGTPVPEER
ncbi:MAG: MATE family efflux transporter [Clostridiales bacterium]|nr:MATE family efflux transporter [Clostridiales bacterium]